MAKKYFGFGVRIKEEEKGLFFKRTEKEEVFCRLQVGGVDNFAEAQEVLCDKMAKCNIVVAFIFPYSIKEEEK